MKVLADCSTNLAARSRPSAVANSSEIRAQSVTLETSPPYLVASLNQIRHAWFAWGPGVQGWGNRVDALPGSGVPEAKELLVGAKDSARQGEVRTPS